MSDPGFVEAFRRKVTYGSLALFLLTHPRDAAVFVIEGGRIRQRETRGGNECAQELDLASSTVLWQPGGYEREITNVGSERYRELRVEFR